MIRYLANPKSKTRSACALLIGTLLFTCAPGFAQNAGSPQGATVQAVGLFMRSCFPLAGAPSALRAWAAEHHLAPLSGEQAIAASEGRASQSFGANTPDGPLALVSEDSGVCKVVAFQGDDNVAMQTLNESLEREKVSVSPGGLRMQPDGLARQDVYLATLGRRRWELSITAQTHREAPNLPPEIILTSVLSNL